MDEKIFDQLTGEHEIARGCYQPQGGPCFYIASDPTEEDHKECGSHAGHFARFLVEESAKPGPTEGV